MTMEKALEYAEKYYKKNKNKAVICERFYNCKLSEIITFADKHNVKYSDVMLNPLAKSSPWDDAIEPCFDVIFAIKMTEKERESVIKQYAINLRKW